MNDPLKILIVDDDENDLSITLGALAAGDGSLHISAAHDGVEAMDYLHGRGEFKSRDPGNPAALVLDLNMPRVDGWEVLRQIKADAALKTIPVIIFTSSSRERDVRQSYELGANAYVVKPIDHSEFVSAIQEICSFWTHRNHPPPGPLAGTAGPFSLQRG